MKIRFLTFGSLLLVAATVLTVQSHQAPPQPPLGNFDARKTANKPPTIVNSQKVAAASLLGARVNGLRWRQDEQTGRPRFLAAQRGFLTGSGAGGGLSQAGLATVSATEPHRLVKAFVNEHSALFGHDAVALSAARIKVDAITPGSGMRTVIWQQTLDDIPVYGGLFVSHRTKNDELISVSSRLVADLTQAASHIPQRAQLVATPPLNAAEAIRRAAQNLGETALVPVESLGAAQGVEKKQSFRSSRLVGAAHTQLVWLPGSDDALQLCWQVVLTSRVRPEMYLVLLNAQNGELLLRRCLTDYISPATYNVYTSDSPSPFSPGLDVPSSFQPELVPRTLVTLSALNTNASPDGWINDGDNETLGNNVAAHLDRNDDDLPDLPRPQGVTRVFDFPLDLTQSPAAYGNASVVNLFYWNNFCHDRLYEFGFTEEFGNFQQNNFGRGGMGGDRVQADGQDGGGVNNANFSTPPDGLPGRMQMYLFDGPNPDRDGSLDAEVMIHEYVHGLSNRLLGGGAGISELQTAGMGEGWSDFYALSLLSETNDDPHAVYAAGGYLTYQLFGLEENYYFGIRRYPYTTDMGKNPLTLKDIDPIQADAHLGVPISPLFGGGFAEEVHNQGEVWCVTLWEARANLIEKLGPVAGNNTMLQLVTDGLKLAPENATFLEARDGILLADEILSGGDNLAELWFAFAKRGMGFSASVPTSDTTVGVVEAYDVPDFITVGPPDGILEIKVTPATSSAIFGNQTNLINVRITDGASVTNATIQATLSSGPSLTFLNNGVAPDLTANNAIYTAGYATPNVNTNVTLTLVISAPGKDTATNVVTYTIVPLPPNDNLANATKVAAAGGSFVTLNTRATIEFGEPLHAGVASVTASLWWSFTPATNGPVLVDTAGSDANTVVAVYTNGTISTLQLVGATNDIGNRQQAFVIFNGKAGTAYRIVVASYDENSKGTIRLAVTPGGVPDTTPPSVTVTSPPSGLTLATNRITLVGTAIDPDPNPAGLEEVEIRVMQINVTEATSYLGGGVTTSSLISTNWVRSVGLFVGLNQLVVTVRDRAGNRSAPVVLQATYRPLDPPNDFFVNALTLTGPNGTNSVNTLLATKEINEPVHAANPGGKSAWWKYQPPFDGQLFLTTTNSTFDTLLAVYQGSSLGSLVPLAENDDAPDAVDGHSALFMAVRSNQVYRIAVDGFDSAGGAVFLQYQLVPTNVYRLTIVPASGGTVLPGSMDVVAGKTIQVTATPNLGSSFDLWTGDIVSLANPLAVVLNGNRTLTANFLPIPYTDGFESGGFAVLGWTTTGNSLWSTQTTNVAAGTFAARSGVIGANQTSSLFLTRNFHSGVGSFGLRVSSEPSWDYLAFYLDGSLQQQWSGEVAWTSFGFPLSAGVHTLEWRYRKDANNSSGLDAAFIDNVNLPLVVTTNSSTAAHLTARRQSDGLVFIDLLGQTNQLYLLQSSTNLLNWHTIATQVNVNGFTRTLDPGSLTNRLQFYRTVTPAP